MSSDLDAGTCNIHGPYVSMCSYLEPVRICRNRSSNNQKSNDEKSDERTEDAMSQVKT